MPGPQYFQNPFYDWNSFTNMMGDVARSIIGGPLGSIAQGYMQSFDGQRAPTQAEMEQAAQRAYSIPAGSRVPAMQGYNQFPEYAANNALSRSGIADYSIYAKPSSVARSAFGQPPMPYVNYDPQSMEPMGPLGNSYYQQEQRLPGSVNMAVSPLLDREPNIMNPGGPWDVYK